MGWGGEEANSVLHQAVQLLQWEVEVGVVAPKWVPGGAGSSTPPPPPPPDQPSNKVRSPRHLHPDTLSYSPGERVLQKIDGIHARLPLDLHPVKRRVERTPHWCTRTAREELKVYLEA